MVGENPLSLQEVLLKNLLGTTIFLIMRNRVMSNTDPSALFYLYSVMQHLVNDHEGGQRSLQVQLGKEYGSSFEQVLKAPPPAPNVSQDDVERVLGWLKHSDRFKTQLEDYEPGGASIDLDVPVSSA